jgi:UDP-glucuronate decarboxylase
MRSHSTDSLEVVNRKLEWHALNDAVVVVTGAGGFLGSALVEALLARHDLSEGHQPRKIIAVVRDVPRARVRLGSHPALQIFEHDLAKPMSGFPAFTHAIHAASNASPRFYGVDPVGTMLPNTLGTHGLLELARRNDARFLFVSSGEVYGELPPDWIPTREHEFGFLDPTDVRSCYAESKRAGETLCASYARQFGVHAVIARPFHTYGPGIDLNDGRVFADFVRDVVAREDIVLHSDGLARRAFCYVTDAVLGILTILVAGVPGEAYNVGSPENEVSIGDLSELLVGLFPERDLKVRRAPRDVGNYMISPITRNSPNTDKLQGLGWNATVGLEEGFTRTVRGIESRLARENMNMEGARCS